MKTLMMINTSNAWRNGLRSMKAAASAAVAQTHHARGWRITACAFAG
jgi:hypothetical protein